MKLVNVDDIIDISSLLSDNSTEKFLCNTVEHANVGDIHFMQE